MKVLFAGGGTGGHLYPALAVAQELEMRDARFEAMFVGTRSGLEARVVQLHGYPIRFISSKGVRGKGPVGKIVTGVLMVIGIFQAAAIILRYQPDIVFGSGGYASAAAATAGSLLGRTVVIQEQNSVPGMTNRILGPRARRIYLGFEKAAEYFKSSAAIRITGNPLRRSIAGEHDGGLRSKFGLSNDKPVIFVFGGSQGAMTISKAAVEYFKKRDDVQGIIQTGSAGYESVRRLLSGMEDRIHVTPFIDDISDAYRVADIALARSGALSVSELAAMGVPSILVPYPFAADNHQLHNARVLAEMGGAEIIMDDELDRQRLADVLDRLIAAPEILERMRNALGEFREMNAAAEIADDMLALAGGGPDMGGETMDGKIEKA
jgi:UDP-N-acetylglucosamine--N-acetylmuramyl-(pentapeptide) pyrophosphoryl-undecaprenol N-acetylglucosamine transferase